MTETSGSNVRDIIKLDESLSDGVIQIRQKDSNHVHEVLSSKKRFKTYYFDNTSF